MTATRMRKGPRCPECWHRLGYNREPYGRFYQCTNMQCMFTFDDNDGLGDDPVTTRAVLLGEPVEIVRHFTHCGKALEANDRSCALPQGHRTGPCVPASDL